MLSRVISISIIGGISVLFVLATSIAFAQPQDGFVPLVDDLPLVNDATDISDVLNALFGLAVGAAAILAVIMIAIGGFQYMASEAFTSKESARERIVSAVIGLLLVLSSVLLLAVINPDIIIINPFRNAATIGDGSLPQVAPPPGQGTPVTGGTPGTTVPFPTGCDPVSGQFPDGTACCQGNTIFNPGQGCGVPNQPAPGGGNSPVCASGCNFNLVDNEHNSCRATGQQSDGSQCCGPNFVLTPSSGPPFSGCVAGQGGAPSTNPPAPAGGPSGGLPQVNTGGGITPLPGSGVNVPGGGVLPATVLPTINCQPSNPATCCAQLYTYNAATDRCVLISASQGTL